MKATQTNNIFFNKVYIGILIASAVALGIRAFFSFDFLDESFYLAVTDRFWKGDSLIVDEWHPTQFFFPLLLPLYTIYRFIVPMGVGVYLFFRISAIVLSGVLAIVIYSMSKQLLSPLSSFMVAIATMLYCRGNISGITYYNTYAVCIVMVGLCIVVHAEKGKSAYLLFAGIGIAIATCSMPFFILADLILGILFLSNKRGKELGVMLLGVLLIAFPYLLFLAKSLENPKLFLQNFPMIMTDAEHAMGWARTVVSATKVTSEAISIPGMIWVIVSLLYVIVFRRKAKEDILAYGTVAVFLCVLIFGIRNIDRPYVYLTILSFSAFLYNLLFNRDRKNVKYGCYCYYAGLAASICFVSGSNVNIDAISTGCVLSCVGVFFLFEDMMLKDLKDTRKYIVYIAEVLLCTVCFGQRIICVYNDAPIWTHNCRIESGPAKGLYVTTEKKHQYDEHMVMVNSIVKRYPELKSLYLNGVPSWIYVALPYKCGVNSVWQEFIPEERFDKYFDINSKPVPDMVILGGNGNPCTGTNSELYKPMVGETIYRDYSDVGYVYVGFTYADVYIKKDKLD